MSPLHSTYRDFTLNILTFNCDNKLLLRFRSGLVACSISVQALKPSWQHVPIPRHAYELHMLHPAVLLAVRLPSYISEKKNTTHTKIMKKKHLHYKRFSIYIKFLLNSGTLGHFFIKATLKVLTIVQTWNPRISKNRKEGDEGFERRTEKLTSGSMSWLQQISKCWTLNFGGFGGPLLRAGLLYDVSSSKVT